MLRKRETLKKVRAFVLIIFITLSTLNIAFLLQGRGEPERIMRQLGSIIEKSDFPLGSVTKEISDEKYPVNVYYVSEDNEITNINNFDVQDTERLPLKPSPEPIAFNLGDENYLISLQESNFGFKILLLYDLTHQRSTSNFILVESFLVIALLITLLMLRFSTERLEFIQKNREREEELFLVSSLSHELKTPLSAIIGYGETINNGHMSKSAEYYGGKILAQATRLESSIKQLLDISSLNLNSLSFSNDITFNELLRSVIKEKEIPSSSVHYGVIEDFTVKKEPFTLILSNILTNFKQHAEPNSTLSITSYHSGQSLVLLLTSSEDAGFKPLSEVIESRRSTGLGLKIIELASRKTGCVVEVSADFSYKITF